MRSVLLLGESGTGKELLARAVHTLSPRADKPFVAINCAAIPDTLLESELFGYEKGAFTGAVKQTPGKIEQADGRHAVPRRDRRHAARRCRPSCCVSCRTASSSASAAAERLPVDVRVVCATNKNLRRCIKTGEFRDDLYYRISEVMVRIPPLRERGGDAGRDRAGACSIDAPASTGGRSRVSRTRR